MDSFRKNVELAANFAIVVVAVLLCVVLVKNQLASGQATKATGDQPDSKGALKTGGKIDLPGVNWQKNGQTLVLALSTTCHFCTESAAFYRRLKQESGGAHFLAVFQQVASDGKSYLSKLDVPVDEVRQVPFERLNVPGTPTLLLIDGSGEVKDSWVGKLPPNQEAQVIARLNQK